MTYPLKRDVYFFEPSLEDGFERPNRLVETLPSAGFGPVVELGDFVFLRYSPSQKDAYFPQPLVVLPELDLRDVAGQCRNVLKPHGFPDVVSVCQAPELHHIAH
jgi:hypothetical protein